MKRHLRKATLNDADSIMTVVNKAYQIERDGGAVSFKNCDRYLSINEVKVAFQKGHYLCCIEGKTKKLIGVVYYQSIDKGLHIGPLAVAPEYQGQRIGTDLLNEMERKCKQLDKKWIKLKVVSARTDLNKFYEKKGYTYESNVEKATDIGLMDSQLTKAVSVLTLKKILSKRSQ